MKFICLGYFAAEKWESMSEAERKARMEENFAYDDVLRKGGHIVGGEALEPPRNATTLRVKNGKVMVTDGPYAETKEQLGGLLIIEAKDREQAIELLSKHPALQNGVFELRARDEKVCQAFEDRQKGAGSRS
jgi:hypothetical protein